MNSCFWFIKLRFVHFFLLAAPGRCETDFRFGGQRRGLRRDAAVALDPKNLMVKIPWWKWRETSGWEVVKSTSTAIKAPEGKRPGLRSWHMSKKTFEKEISLVFFRKNVGSSFHVGSILVDFDVECMQWIWWIWWIWIRHAREMTEMCAWMYSWIDFFLISSWFMLIYVDLCPGGFQHKSWRLHHDEIILAVAQEERDSLGSSRVHFCRCVRLVSDAGTSCTRNEMMWTTCISAFGHNSVLQFKKIAEFQHTSGSLASLLGMCAFQVCRKQCCILHFRVRTWEIPASLTCQKLPKWCCKMMLQLIPPHVFNYSSFVLLHFGGSFTSTESRHCRCQIIVLQGHDATNRTRLIASGEPREIGNRQGRFWNSILPILLFDSLSR